MEKLLDIKIYTLNTRLMHIDRKYKYSSMHTDRDECACDVCVPMWDMKKYDNLTANELRLFENDYYNLKKSLRNKDLIFIRV